jgi:hypothetical protein
LAICLHLGRTIAYKGDQQPHRGFAANGKGKIAVFIGTAASFGLYYQHRCTWEADAGTVITYSPGDPERLALCQHCDESKKQEEWKIEFLSHMQFKLSKSLRGNMPRKLFKAGTGEKDRAYGTYPSLSLNLYKLKSDLNTNAICR